MKFIDLFAGIGGFRLGMEQAGHECVAFCEIDKFARKSYKNIHNKTVMVIWCVAIVEQNGQMLNVRESYQIEKLKKWKVSVLQCYMNINKTISY